MKTKTLLLIFAIIVCSSAFAQETFPPVVISQGTFLGETIPLRDAPTMEVLDEEATSVIIINQQFNGTNIEPTGGSPDGHDPLVQTEAAFYQSRNLVENFQGASIAEGQAVPPDPSGAVGPNHYVHAVNLVVKIFDKSGGLLAGPTSLGSFLGNGSSNGDPIVMYDQLADRFFVSQFQISTDALIIGMSTTADPTGTYNVYSFPLDAFPDYPHYNIWPDAYYMTANKFQGNTTYALDRVAMLAGDPSPAIVGFNLPGVVRNPNTVFSPEPANLLGTTLPPAGAPGYIIYLQDDSWPGISDDHLKIWELDIDFAGISTVSAPAIIPIADFDSFFRPFGSGDFDQPSTNQRVDGASGVISYMANYRSFPGHNSFVINFNSDIGGQNGLKQGAIRWVELRNTGTGPFSVYQEGTWSMPDGISRFMGSNSMDANGNIALGYNVSSKTLNVGMRYTGRLDGDPLGIMTFPETSIFEGGAFQSNTNRFGDYAQMTIDPNGSTFWHTSQYFATINSWRTRIAAFELEPLLTNDVGAYSITAPSTAPYTASETVTADIYNFGSSSQTGFDVELYFDGILMATETFSGTIAASSSGSHTFATTLDMSTAGVTYTIEIVTALSGDMLATNDAFSKDFRDDNLGIEDTTLGQEGLLIYPIQDRNYEVFYSTSNDFGAMSYKIFDILGKEYAGGLLNAQTNGYKATFNMSAAATGVYVVKITNGTESVSKQILIR
ncbi:MAG: hypothetical protein ACJATF_002789 [Flavobacteriales bacterium]|jgi:hypothetical protein